MAKEKKKKLKQSDIMEGQTISELFDKSDVVEQSIMLGYLRALADIRTRQQLAEA